MRNKIHRQKTSIENIIPTAAIFTNWEKFARILCEARLDYYILVNTWLRKNSQAYRYTS